MAHGYIHGTDPSEQARLAELNRRTNSWYVRFLGVAPGMRVLEVGSGLGILAAAVAAAAEGVQVVGVERSPAQITAAVADPRVRYVQGDAHALDFPDGSFDLVYARYVLEHVTQPERVLAEMRRVVKGGGRVAVCENDVTLFRIDPPCPAADQVWAAFARYQATLGGDATIGRRLFRLLGQAGLSRIELSVQPEVHWHGSQDFTTWVENIVGNIDSARRGLVQSNFCTTAEIDRAVGELRERIDDPSASSCFMWNLAAGIR